MRLLQGSLLCCLVELTFAQILFGNDFSAESSHFSQQDFDGFKHFGTKTTSLLKSLSGEEKSSSLLSFNGNLEDSFEHNLISPNIPDVLAPIKSTIRYTNTPLETYQVTEDVYEPRPIPQISLAKPIVGKPPPLILGSGSLGFVSLGDGKYALGSGSLGYSRPVKHKHEEAVGSGGLHVVPPPRLGSSEAFDAAFNNFDFKPLHRFFEHD